MSADNPFSERRIMTQIAALALIFAVAGKAHAQEETFVARGAGLCALSSNLREADEAARLRDQAWLKRLDCFEGPMFSFSELKQAIVRSGQKCERVRGVLNILAIHTVTCQIGTTRTVYYDLTARTGDTTVLRVERRRNY
jgi:hypothetical protein